MFNFLSNLQLGLAGLLLFSWVRLFFLPAGARDARWSNKRDTGIITLLGCGWAALVWFLERSGRHQAASLVLYGFFGLALGWLLWALKKANWR